MAKEQVKLPLKTLDQIYDEFVNYCKSHPINPVITIVFGTNYPDHQFGYLTLYNCTLTEFIFALAPYASTFNESGKQISYPMIEPLTPTSFSRIKDELLQTYQDNSGIVRNFTNYTPQTIEIPPISQNHTFHCLANIFANASARELQLEIPKRNEFYTLLGTVITFKLMRSQPVMVESGFLTH